MLSRKNIPFFPREANSERGDIPLGWVPLTRTGPVPASFRVQKSWRE
jgi:hypothetical protein